MDYEEMDRERISKAISIVKILDGESIDGVRIILRSVDDIIGMRSRVFIQGITETSEDFHRTIKNESMVRDNALRKDPFGISGGSK